MTPTEKYLAAEVKQLRELLQRMGKGMQQVADCVHDLNERVKALETKKCACSNNRPVAAPDFAVHEDMRYESKRVSEK